MEEASISDACEFVSQRSNGFCPKVGLILGSGVYGVVQYKAKQAALEAGWDLLVVDEAHHLVWHPEMASPA